MSPPTLHDRNEGRLVGGRYRLTAVIGRGGMGTVWRAHDELLDRHVAVKEVMTPPGLEPNERDVIYQRTFREARASARLNHPGVVTIHDVVREDDRPWIIMEFVRGRPLQEIIDQNGPLPARRVAEIGHQLLEALTHAHAAGILHRDVKPSNILITEQGQARLTDFGIAQMPGDVNLTQTGLVMGSPAYIAPERAQGDKAIPASDLWALGATLYTAVEGRSPYERGDAMAALAAMLTEDPPPTRQAGQLGPIIQGLLVRDPTRRMPAAAALPLLADVASVDPARHPPPLLASHPDWEAEPRRGATRSAPEPGSGFRPAVYDPGFAGNGPSSPDGMTHLGYGSGPGGGPPWPRLYGSSPPQAPPRAEETRPDEDRFGSGPLASSDRLATERIPQPLGSPRRLTWRERLRDWLKDTSSTRFKGGGPEAVPQSPLRTVDGASPQADTTHGRRPQSALYSPLREHFQYIHEPLQIDEMAIPLLGNEQLIRSLKERLTNSRGGTFLITGFRGVGKTTLVERALAEMAAEHRHGRRVLPVVISVARPMQTDKLLFAIVRRVFEELTEAGVLDDLPAATRQSLLQAYMRTSLSFKETRSDARERAANVSVNPAKVVGEQLGIPKMGISTKRSRSLATEAAFLAYSETDVEHDMMRIVRLLSSTTVQRTRGWRRLTWWRRHTPFDLQLVVVLDEVDKLTAVKDDLDDVERLLSGIKNVVTMRGAHYLMVAGPDLHDQVLRDSGRGNSIYESIFAWHLYVPCSWSAPHRLLENLFPDTVDLSSGIIDEFERYLRFKSRGVLRRLLHELNTFVVWEDVGKPYLRISSQSHKAVSLYAQIERSLDDFFVATRRQVLQTPLTQDRWRLGGYYVMDWILRSEGRPFTSADVIPSVDSREIDALLRVTRTGVDMLLEHLLRDQILDVVRPSAQATSTHVADVTDAQLPSYKLNDALLNRLLGIAVQNEEERAELYFHHVSLAAEMARENVPIETLANRYQLLRLIGEGATSSVYEGRDALLHRPVAVKMLRSALSDDPMARRRFLREARIAEGVHHPNVVDVYEMVTLEQSHASSVRQFAIVMELFTEPTLREELQERGPLSPCEVAQTGIGVAGALEYLAEKGLARFDIKPNNIVMTPIRGPVIIGLGIAKIVKDSHIWLVESDNELENEDPATQTGIVIGTPAYLAPEQIHGDEAVDIRADIYALGLVLYTCLAGRHPYEGVPMVAIFANTVNNDLDVAGLPCSPELREVIARATARDLAQRFQSPAELLAALRDTPEAQSPGDTRRGPAA